MRRTFSIFAATAVALGAVLTAGGAAYADTATTVNLSTVTAVDGTAGITAISYFTTSSVVPGATTSLHTGVTQPANSCRLDGSCAPGFPNNGAVVTITGLAAAGLTYSSGGSNCVQQNADTVVCLYTAYNNYLKTDNIAFAVSATATPGNYPINVGIHVFDKTLPTMTSQCKDGGWAAFNDASDNPMFKNQGDCVSYVATGGKNA